MKTLVRLLVGFSQEQLSRLEDCCKSVRRPAGGGQQTRCSAMRKKRSTSGPRKSVPMGKKPLQPSAQMPVINPHAAGIDIGATSHWVCVPEDAAAAEESPVREFGASTP